MTLNDLNSGFKVTVLFTGECLKTVYIIQFADNSTTSPPV